ncbi:MAG: preprotein translocase subunit SecE [Patescibacteria group bacterium]|nr:preprotein translocase subunit SecE [Patescibacteria group bacterium]
MKFIKRYIQEVIQEIKKVSWPDKEQTINKTVLVIVVSVLVSIYIGGLDLILQQAMKLLLK